MMSLVVAILLGVAMGALVELTVPGRTLSEGLLTGLLGVVGSLVTRFMGLSAGWFWADEPQCILAEMLGADLLLIAYLILSRRQRHRRTQH
jgi:uncharacterized membrane protein YeaQ/YmgE (transglycosylase-associated protein family)